MTLPGKGEAVLRLALTLSLAGELIRVTDQLAEQLMEQDAATEARLLYSSLSAYADALQAAQTVILGDLTAPPATPAPG